MKKHIVGLVLALSLAASVFGQTVSLNVAETAATKIVVKTFCVDDTAQTVMIVLQYQDSASAAKREVTLAVPANVNSPGTEYVDFLSALGTAAPNETGTVRRRANYRVLNYLVTTYPRISGVTLVP